MNANVAKAVAEEGGINILAGLARSMNRLVAEEAAGGLWNLSVGEEHKVCYNAIVDFILCCVLNILMSKMMKYFQLGYYC